MEKKDGKMKVTLKCNDCKCVKHKVSNKDVCSKFKTFLRAFKVKAKKSAAKNEEQKDEELY